MIFVFLYDQLCCCGRLYLYFYIYYISQPMLRYKWVSYWSLNLSKILKKLNLYDIFMIILYIYCQQLFNFFSKTVLTAFPPITIYISPVLPVFTTRGMCQLMVTRYCQVCSGSQIEKLSFSIITREISHKAVSNEKRNATSEVKNNVMSRN